MTDNTTFLPWQQKPWEILRHYIQQARIPQALLISGAYGIGKSRLAHQFSLALLCENKMEDKSHCGRCHSCTLINAQTHPDYLMLMPEEEKTTITINQIRQIVAGTYLKPQFAGYRVLIINPADAMTLQAINAFLKCLEEPGERTVFILITDKPSRLPATIISRCQQLSLNLSDTNALVGWLHGQGIRQNQETLVNLMRSSLLSLDQVNDVTLLTQRLDCFNDWLAIAQHKKHPVLVSEKWQKMPKTVLINWQISWLSDVIKCVYRLKSEYLCNQDLAQAIQSLAQQLQLDNVYQLYDKLLICRHQLDSQLNLQLMLDDLLIQWQELNRR